MAAVAVVVTDGERAVSAGMTFDPALPGQQAFGPAARASSMRSWLVRKQEPEVALAAESQLSVDRRWALGPLLDDGRGGGPCRSTPPVRVRMVGPHGVFGGVEVIRAYWSQQGDEAVYDVVIPGVEEGLVQAGVPASRLRPYAGQTLPRPPSFHQPEPQRVQGPPARHRLELQRLGEQPGWPNPSTKSVAGISEMSAKLSSGMPQGPTVPWDDQGGFLSLMKHAMFELGAAAAAGAAAATIEAQEQQQALIANACAAQLAVLEERKAIAIAAEQYEEAANIRNEMMRLQRKQFSVENGVDAEPSGVQTLSALGFPPPATPGLPSNHCDENPPTESPADPLSKARFRSAVHAVKMVRPLPPRPVTHESRESSEVDEVEVQRLADEQQAQQISVSNGSSAVRPPNERAAAAPLRFRGAVRAVQAQRALPPRPDATVTATGANAAEKPQNGSTRVAFGEFAKVVNKEDPRHQILENLRRTEQQEPPPPLARAGQNNDSASSSTEPASQPYAQPVESEAGADAEEGLAPPPKKSSSRPGWGVRAVREALSKAALVSTSADQKEGEIEESEPEAQTAVVEAVPEPEPEPTTTESEPRSESQSEPEAPGHPTYAGQKKGEIEESEREVQPAVVEAVPEPEPEPTTTEPEPRSEPQSEPEATGKKRFGLF